MVSFTLQLCGLGCLMNDLAKYWFVPIGFVLLFICATWVSTGFGQGSARFRADPKAHIDNLLKQLKDEVSFEFRVIADQKPNFDWTDFDFIPWSKDNEIKDLLGINIGIMPIPDDQWTQGKCGFKILQYSALGIPSLASSVGVNSSIIKNGDTGYLCNSDEEWKQYLRDLITDEGLRTRMGKAGREQVVQNYSVLSNAANFFSFFA